MTVTDADDWKEDWIPQGPLFSEVTLFSPVPQSLRGPEETRGVVSGSPTGCVRS